MALGVPVVATTLNGLAQVVVHGRTGLVVPERDPDALAAALRKLLDDEALAAGLARAARAHVEREYALSSVVARLRELIERCP
jgi:glycosyltransferase involved in cell wall biosynthesis